MLSLAALAVASAAIWALEPHAPVVSLGVLYLFAVLPVAAIWGLPFAIPVSIVGMIAFNWLFLPPTHTLRLADSENWVALAVYLVTAISVSALSDRAQRRTEEAEERRREAEGAMAEARASEERRLQEAVEAEALRRSDAAKTAVLRSVSHDLRSPITAITTASEVLRELGTPSPTRIGTNSWPPSSPRCSDSIGSSPICSNSRDLRRAQRHRRASCGRSTVSSLAH